MGSARFYDRKLLWDERSNPKLRIDLHAQELVRGLDRFFPDSRPDQCESISLGYRQDGTSLYVDPTASGLSVDALERG
jgi:hypothetical protein